MCHSVSSQTLHGHGNTCGCHQCGCGVFSRRFVSSKEEITMLEHYSDQLENELEGVKERMKELDDQ